MSVDTGRTLLEVAGPVRTAIADALATAVVRRAVRAGMSTDAARQHVKALVHDMVGHIEILAELVDVEVKERAAALLAGVTPPQVTN